jgi:plasmid replication initiation protein
MTKQKQALYVSKKRKGIIRTGSDFARNCRYGLTLQEQRVIYYAIMKGEMEKKSFQPVIFTVKEFAALCGLNSDGTYKTLRRTSANLLMKIVEYTFEDENGDTVLRQAPWVIGIDYRAKMGTVTVRLNPLVEPLFRKYKQFTETEFIFLCKFSCQYSERLYELLKSMAFKPAVDFNIEDLRERLGLKMQNGKKAMNKYPNYNDFEKRVLIPAKDDINIYTDLDIDYRAMRGRYNKVETVVFSIRKKPNYIPLAERIQSRNFPQLEGQITLFENDEEENA